MCCSVLYIEAASFQTTTEWTRHSVNVTATATSGRVDVREAPVIRVLCMTVNFNFNFRLCIMSWLVLGQCGLTYSSLYPPNNMTKKDSFVDESFAIVNVLFYMRIMSLECWLVNLLLFLLVDPLPALHMCLPLEHLYTHTHKQPHNIIHNTCCIYTHPVCACSSAVARCWAVLLPQQVHLYPLLFPAFTAAV